MADMRELIHYLKRNLRIFWAKPAFSAMVVLILAVAIAGNTAVFSVFNRLFLRPLPFTEPDRLIDLDETAPPWNLVHVGIANSDLHQWRTQNSTFESMAFFRMPSCNLTVGHTTERILSAQVTREMLDVLRMQALIGRNFNEEEDRHGGSPVVLLSYGLWQRTFGGSRDVLGTTVKIDDQPYVVIGVLPRGAVFPDRAELWIPLAPDANANTGYYANGIGRLKPGVSIQQAQADLLRIHKSMIAQGRSINRITSPLLMPLRERYLGEFKRIGSTLLGAVAIVLLIACVNIASLMMVHNASRSGELWIRTALGASRGRIISELFAQTGALALVGGIIGILAGVAGVHAAAPALSNKLPGWITFSVDWRFVLFSFAIAGAATMPFGIFPALRSSKVDIRASQRSLGVRTTSTRQQRRTLSTFVVCEISLALILSISTGLLLQAFRKVMQVDPGFQPENALSFSVRIPDSSYPNPDQKIAYFDRLLERLQSLPGVKAVGATSSPPLGGQWGGVFEAEDGLRYNPQGDNPTVSQVAVTSGYFRAIGMTLIAGRVFRQQDGQPQPRLLAIVNQTFAKHFWTGGSPVGRRIRRLGSDDWLEVIGVVRDEKHYGLDQPVLPSVFLPYPTAMATAQRGDERALQQMSIVLRSASDPSALVGSAREILRQLDPDVPMYAVQTMMETLDASLWTRQAYSWLFGVFALVAISLSAAGIYGTVSYGVSQRTREIGVRMALGARREQVLAQTLFSAMRTTLLGVSVGLPAAFGATKWLQSLLFGVNSHDPFVYAAVVLGMTAIALLATLAPACRAAKVDPMLALRYE